MLQEEKGFSISTRQYPRKSELSKLAKFPNHFFEKALAAAGESVNVQPLSGMLGYYSFPNATAGTPNQVISPADNFYSMFYAGPEIDLSASSTIIQTL